MVTQRITTTGGDFDAVLTVRNVTGIAEERGFRLCWDNIDGTGYVPALGLVTSHPFRSRGEAEAYAVRNYGGVPASDPIRRADGLAYLMRHGNLGVPGGRYGSDTRSCATIAWRLSVLMARETGNPMSYAQLESDMGAVVNSSDDVAYIIRNYGRRKWS